ncbi:MAG: DUF488 family protein [Nitrososphaeraceae archaeon]
MARVFTIGHSNRQWSDFISILKDNHVDLLVDIRRYPGSRACPQFNKEQMTIELNNESVSYVHIEKLGGRRNMLDANKDRRSDNNNTGWKNKSFRAYADYMVTISFREGINELLSLIQKRPNLAIMCSEAVPWRCHRRMVADYLVMVEGISVYDILDGEQQPASHKLTSFAHLTDDKIITYPQKMQ